MEASCPGQSATADCGGGERKDDAHDASTPLPSSACRSTHSCRAPSSASPPLAPFAHVETCIGDSLPERFCLKSKPARRRPYEVMIDAEDQ